MTGRTSYQPGAEIAVRVLSRAMGTRSKRGVSNRTTFVPSMLFKTAFVAVVPTIAACSHSDQLPPGVAYQSFEASGASGESDAGRGADVEATDAIDATAVPNDAPGLEAVPADFHPPIPPAVAQSAFENPPSTTTATLATDAGASARPRRRR